MGIAKYNSECRKIVTRYAQEWEVSAQSKNSIKCLLSEISTNITMDCLLAELLLLSCQEIMTRLGRWIDFRNDYKTMYPSFMESVWWAFKQLFNKGLVYRGFKVMPFSTACNTPLSNFEAGQNYKDVTDPAGKGRLYILLLSVLLLSTLPWQQLHGYRCLYSGCELSAGGRRECFDTCVDDNSVDTAKQRRSLCSPRLGLCED